MKTLSTSNFVGIGNSVNSDGPMRFLIQFSTSRRSSWHQMWRSNETLDSWTIGVPELFKNISEMNRRYGPCRPRYRYDILNTRLWCWALRHSVAPRQEFPMIYLGTGSKLHGFLRHLDPQMHQTSRTECLRRQQASRMLGSMTDKIWYSSFLWCWPTPNVDYTKQYLHNLAE